MPILYDICLMDIQLREIRRARKIKIKEMPLDYRTIRKIESGSEEITVKSLKTYLNAVGLNLTYSL